MQAIDMGVNFLKAAKHLDVGAAMASSLRLFQVIPSVDTSYLVGIPFALKVMLGKQMLRIRLFLCLVLLTFKLELLFSFSLSLLLIVPN